MNPEHWLRLNRTYIAPGRQLALLERFGGPEAVFGAGRGDFLDVEGVAFPDWEKLEAARGLDLTADLRALAEHDAHLVTIRDAEYPARLKAIYDPPPVLFVRGALTPRDDQAVAMVGTRRCSHYGVIQTERLAGDLARRGFTIVSGLAVGIDGAAHRGALDAGGRSIGVLACGVDVDYPREHRELRDRLAESGAVITELAPGLMPKRERFPQRNRLVSGLSLGVIVVEAPLKSGALITANLALEQGREVLAVPGDVSSALSRGCHRLIKDGAGLVENVDDVLDALGILHAAVPERERPAQPVPELPPEERAIMEALSFQPKHVDAIIGDTALLPARVTAALMMLEVKGLVRRFPGNMFVRL